MKDHPSGSGGKPPLTATSMDLHLHTGQGTPLSHPRPAGLYLVLRQLLALSRKNLLIRWRNRQAAAVQVLQAIAFMVLIWVIQAAIYYSNRQFSALRTVHSPHAEPISHIPLCTSSKFIQQGKACYTLLYSPANDSVVDQLMSNIRLRNRPTIPAEQVLAFNGTAEVDQYLQQHPATTLAAVHFKLVTNQTMRFIVQTNTSIQYFKGQYQDPNTFMQLPLQQAVEREAVRMFTRDDALRWEVAIAEFPHPSLEVETYVSRIAPVFVLASLMFNFVALLTAVVSEKERGVRSAMAAMGLRSAALWGSWLVQEAVTGAVHAVLLCVMGLILRLDMFVVNSFGLVFLLVYTADLALSALALVFSTVLQRSASAAPVGFALYIVAWVFQMVIYFGFPYRQGFSVAWQALFSLFPWSLLSKGVVDMADATVGKPHGISWARRTAYCRSDKPPPAEAAAAYFQDNCVMPLGTILWVLALQAVGYSVLAAYIDAVWPGGEERTPLKPWFFLTPLLGWFRKGSQRSCRHVQRALARAEVDGELSSRDEDVMAAAEATRRLARRYILQRSGPASVPAAATADKTPVAVAASDSFRTARNLSLSDAGLSSAGQRAEESGAAQQHKDGDFGRNGAKEDMEGGGPHAGPDATGEDVDSSLLDGLHLFGLRKVFLRSSGPWWRCGYPRKQHAAVVGSWLGVPRGHCLCLLGPNGAGKTTTIKMLTGLLEPSSGDALVCGQSLREPGGVELVQANTGVCPQFDVLWDELTAADHMALFGAIKGLPTLGLAAEAAQLLGQVKLGDVAAVRAGTFSGGMRRRLSVALALLGDPGVLFLDEPTTGMDPVSRRCVWDLIAAAKAKRCVVLTTHSMEEADALGDCVAVMARGALRCLGNGLHLKAKLGSGYRLAVRVSCKAGDGRVDQETSSAQANRLRATAQIILGEEPGEGGDAQDCTHTTLGTDGVTVHVEVPRGREQLLPALFQYLEDNGDELGVADVSVGLPPLEEVFLRVVADAEREWAGSQGLKEDVYIQEEDQTFQVAVGATEVTAPSGRIYTLQWQQDQSDGRLQLRDYSPAAL